MNSHEKRVHVRRQIDRDVLCYIDGQRLDASARDISVGGMFIRTPAMNSVPIGSLVGLVFPGGTHTMTTFLFGKVVRHQDKPEPGVGLCWEKAVSAGNPEVLAKFLFTVFGIQNAKIICESTSRGTRSVFRFEERVQPTDVRARMAPPADALFSSKPKDLPRTDTEGAITSFIKRDDRLYECYVKGLLVEDGETFPVLMTRIGMSSAVVRTVFAHDAGRSKIELQFDIPTREGSSRVIGRGDIQQLSVQDARTLLVTFSYVDEGNAPGILCRYLKWLQFHALAKAQPAGK